MKPCQSQNGTSYARSRVFTSPLNLSRIHRTVVDCPKPNSPEPDQPNEDEGKVGDRNGHARTNQALKWAKTGINEAKLFVYAKTGQITESADPDDISLALQKLDTYREQLSRCK